MFLIYFTLPERSEHLLRTSGDVSMIKKRFKDEVQFAPHERRCFFSFFFLIPDFIICSARAEMFLLF